MMRDIKDYGDDGGKHANASSGKGETWASEGDRFSDLRRERYTFERSPSDKPFSCTRIGAAHDHVDAPAEPTLHDWQAKMDNFAEFCDGIFALRACLCMPLEVR